MSLIVDNIWNLCKMKSTGSGFPPAVLIVIEGIRKTYLGIIL